MTKFRLSVVAALAAVAMAVTACGSGESATAEADGQLEKTSIKVGGLPIADYATVYWAQDKGYFKKEGLDVKIAPLQGGPIGVQQVAAGQLDFSFTNTVSSSIAQSKGVPITTVVLASSLAEKEMGIFVKPNSPIREMDDLDGKSVGINTTQNMGDVTFRRLADTKGLDTKPQWVEVPFGEMVAGVKSGSIDAGYAPEPFKSAAVASGLRMVVDLSSGPNERMAAASFIASKDFVAENPDTTAAFVRAMYAANEDLLSKEKELRAWLPSVAGVDQKTAETLTLPHYNESTDVAGIKDVAEMLKKQGLVPDDFDVTEYIYQDQPKA